MFRECDLVWTSCWKEVNGFNGNTFETVVAGLWVSLEKTTDSQAKRLGLGDTTSPVSPSSTASLVKGAHALRSQGQNCPFKNAKWIQHSKHYVAFLWGTKINKYLRSHTLHIHLPCVYRQRQSAKNGTSMSGRRGVLWNLLSFSLSVRYSSCHTPFACSHKWSIQPHRRAGQTTITR